MAALTASINVLMSEHRDLTYEEARHSIDGIIGGASECQAAALLVLLQAKGETPDEVAGMADAMKNEMLPVGGEAGYPEAIDIVGTGGDGHHTVNISTAASVVAAACGATVAKHGNRSVSSKCGSADVLEACGVKLGLAPGGIVRCLGEAGIAFMFAPGFHPAMGKIKPVRAALGVRTVFNILGPLLNPARCRRMLIGVYAPHLVELMARALHRLGAEFALVVHCGGLDELAPIAAATCAMVLPAGVTHPVVLDTLALGLKPELKMCTIEDLKGGDTAENARILKEVLAGKIGGAVADTVALNAGAGMYVSGKTGVEFSAEKLKEGLKAGIEMARAALAAGTPLEVLEKWAKCSQQG